MSTCLTRSSFNSRAVAMGASSNLPRKRIQESHQQLGTFQRLNAIPQMGSKLWYVPDVERSLKFFPELCYL